MFQFSMTLGVDCFSYHHTNCIANLQCFLGNMANKNGFHFLWCFLLTATKYYISIKDNNFICDGDGLSKSFIWFFCLGTISTIDKGATKFHPIHLFSFKVIKDYLLFVVHDSILCWIRGPLSLMEAC